MVHQFSFPDRIAVIGGGRWARVLLSTVCSIAPASTKITVHTAHNIQAMKSWACEKKIENRIEIYADYPLFDPGKKSAVVVVNAARDHEKAIRWALEAGVPVLVEKPVTLSAKVTKDLMVLAQKNQTKFSSAHIFLFTRYLMNFKQSISTEKDFESIKISWQDPAGESRYGEQKKYDSGLPIFADLMPHVLSLTTALFPGKLPKYRDLKFSRGGAHLKINILLDNVPCLIELVRDGMERKRKIEVFTKANTYSLDFSVEPGTITIGNEKLIGDLSWNTGRRPSEEMLLSYFHWVSGGDFDPRHDIEIGLRANQMIDDIFPNYQSAFSAWLIDNITTSRGKFGDEIRYALSELLQLEGPLASAELDSKVEELRRRYSDKEFLVQLLHKNR